MKVKIVEDSVDLRTRRNDMAWYWWGVIGVGAALVVGATARELPAIRRYLRIKSM